MAKISDVKKALAGLNDKDYEDEKEEIARRNHDAIIKIFDTINRAKGFEVSYSNPSNGKLLVRIDGHVMLVELTQILGSDGLTFEEQVRKNQFLFR